MSFHSTCLNQAQVCRSIIPQLLSPLMELYTDKSKILRSSHTPFHHSHQLYSFPPLQSTLSLVISFFRALKLTSSFFPTFHNFSALQLLNIVIFITGVIWQTDYCSHIICIVLMFFTSSLQRRCSFIIM